MDLSQHKLLKSEWDAMEIPITQEEKSILSMIKNGYWNENIRINENLSLLTFLKISYSEAIEHYLYVQYFEKQINIISKNINLPYNISQTNLVKLKSIDKLRIDNSEKILSTIKFMNYYY